MANHGVGLVKGQHFGLGVELGLVAAVVHLGISGHDDDDGLLADFEAHGLGNTGTLHADSDRRQLHRGGGDVEFPDAVLNAELLEILSYLLNRHGSFPLFLFLYFE